MIQKKSKGANGKKPITYRIKAIELLSHEIGPDTVLEILKLHGAQNAPKLSNSFALSIQLDGENDLLEIQLDYKLTNQDNDLLFSMVVVTQFEIENLDDLVVGDSIKPDNFFQFLISTSMHHARGVQSQLIKESPLKEYYMPAISAKEVLAHKPEKIERE